MKKLLKAIIVLLTITLLCTSCNKPVPSEDGSSEGTSNVTPKTQAGTFTVAVISKNKTPLQRNFLSIGEYFFKDTHPNVKINFQSTDIGNDEEEMAAFQKIATEMMAGRGPDLIYYDSSFGTSIDIYKMFDSELFIDLDTFIKNDKEFNLSDYNTNVIDAIRYDGKQYALPVSYGIPMFYSTKEVMEEAQIN